MAKQTARSSKYVRPIFSVFESVDWEGMNFGMPFTMI